jgi:hypothetical protein
MRPPACGIEPISGAWKASGGLLRVDAKATDGIILEVRVTGDFFVYPRVAVDELEGAMAGVPLDRGATVEAAASVLEREDVEAVGFTSEDLARAFFYEG